MTIYLSKPSLQNKNGKTRLISDVKAGEDEFSLWYEVEEEYGQYLVTERCDSFVISMLPWVMMKAKKIQEKIILQCECCMSAKLYHQLTNYYIPVLSDSISYYSPVQLNIITDSGKLTCVGAIGTGVSGGVDSSYTIAKYIDPLQKFKLTHVLYINVGIYGNYENESEYELQDKTQSIAHDTGLEYLKIVSNICLTLYRAAHAPIVPAIFSGSVLSLQKLFSVYYYSSAFIANDFNINEADAAYYDLLNVHCLSTENVSLYSSGIELTRLQKIAFISDIAFVKNNLFVCLNTNTNGCNCGICAKCTRTMAELEVLGKLDEFGKVFDISAYRKNKGYHWGYVLLKSKKDSFCKEITELYLKKYKRFPLIVYWSAFLKWIKRGFTVANKTRRRVENEIR